MDAEAPKEETARRLLESSLWKEDILAGEHRAVWGSWWDAEAKQWGYACCRGLRRDGACGAAEAASAAAAGADDETPSAVAASAAGPRGSPDSEGEDSSEGLSPDSDANSETRLAAHSEQHPLDWRNPPAALTPRQDAASPAEFVEHFVRFCIGAWRQEREAGFSGFGEMERAAFENALPQTEEALTPLIRRLKKGESLNRGEGRYTSRCRETRTSMEGKYVEEGSVLGQLDRMATMAAEGHYKEAHNVYMRMTLGNKMWNNTLVSHVPACTMKGAREYRRNRDTLNTYDMDPVSQKYMHAMKKLVQFAQCIQPNADVSENVVM